MDRKKNEKIIKRETRKTVAGIKLPPIEPLSAADTKTILDIDPAFYSLVEGRPIRSNKSISKYKQNIKNAALKRTLHGFLVDEILRIDREVETERNIYETAYKHFEEYQNSFDKFLADDNNKTITIMQRSDALAKELTNQTEENKKANFELASIKSKLQYIDETLLILLSFQNFLNKASPILWQITHNIKIDTKNSEICTINSNIYENIDIESIKSKLEELPPPQLYFETPEQLQTIFSLLEKQNLNYMLLTEEFTCEKNKFLKSAELLKSKLRIELNHVQEKIKEIKEIIIWNINRGRELKQVFFKILEEKIRCLVSSKEVLQILNYVEFAFENLIADNETKLSSMDMAAALEREYDNLMIAISVYDLDMIKRIEKETYDHAKNEIKEAKIAAKLLKDVDKLSRRLKTSYEPSRRKTQDF